MVITHTSVLKALGVAGVVIGARPAYAADHSVATMPAPTPIRVAAPEAPAAPAVTLVAFAAPELFPA